MTQATQTIPAGYKQTEIGVIPADWILGKLGELVDYKNGKSFEKFIVEKGKYKLITLNSLDINGKIRKEHLQVNVYDGSLCKDDLIMILSDVAHGNFLGLTDLIPENDKYVLNQRVGALKNVKKVKPYFLSKYINYHQKYFKTTGQGSSQLNLSKGDILNFLVAYPKEPIEQTAIATALSDTDALIEKLEKLIAKKKAIKQGAMQQLLTSKKRLPGFSVEWGKKPMHEIGKTYGGLSGKVKADFGNGNSRYIPFMNIMSNPIIDVTYFDKVNIKANEIQAKAQKNDLFFNGSSETPEEVGMCSVLLDEIPNLYLNSFCFGFRLNKDLETDGLWLSYFFRSSIGRELIYSLAQGATRYNLSKTNFLKLEIPYPESEEQTIIATVLSDMDSEIEKLENKLGKYRQIKTGMMQQLLTGRIRLVKN